ncbi:ANM_HP_G0023000.mRNA.1.CDS.1 [Saccharomyces cerevisiae]|nr:ANM_HP_G0122340.mRNA.1.CDS.1 [Saccharomyces cerevisiae]CAI4972721.1 ANM_HP_G0142260.mRNA.1.CDS.1 [Saccharomyces cerevisiae]CAI5210683.1 ANM_HP_G0271030.mRNA.1.CDS.1 [Saccharomyces cerevisiae]CAI5216838.1 ANM_HP_G0023000.mRNA.1.CDS.1 [Saccharomyces cerevisiae]CAI6575037.1 ANM_HP_G0122340.mRNA.1.CDS.1 [Saccharomyces cerevisiae]
MIQESSPDALAAAAAIGNALSYNGRTVDKSKIPQYNQSFTSRTTSIAGINRYTMLSNSRTNSRMLSMNGNVRQYSKRTSSLPNQGHKNTSNNSAGRRQHRAHEDAETTFREFGGKQSSKVLNISSSTGQNSKSRTTSLGNSGSTIRTIKKYIPGPRGLMAVEVPVEVEPPRYSLSNRSNQRGGRAYSLPTRNNKTSLMHRNKTTKKAKSQEKKSESGGKSKNDYHGKVLSKMHTTSLKQRHNNVPLIPTTMNEETEQELQEDLHDPLEFKPMIISDDENSFIEPSVLDRSIPKKDKSSLSGREKKEEIETLLKEVHSLEEKISNIEIAKLNEEEREQSLILELRKVKLDEERRMELLKRELNIVKENADLEAQELKLIERKRKQHFHKEQEVASEVKSITIRQSTLSESKPAYLPPEDVEKEPSTLSNQTQNIENAENIDSVDAEGNLVDPILLGSLNNSNFHMNSDNEVRCIADSNSLTGSELSDYNYIEGSATDLRATAKTSVESEIGGNQVGLKIPQDDDSEKQEERTKGKKSGLVDTNCFLVQKEDQEEALSDNEPESSEKFPSTSGIENVKLEDETGSVMDKNNGPNNDKDDDDDKDNDNDDDDDKDDDVNDDDKDENVDDDVDDDDDDDDDDEYHDSYDVIMRDPVQIEQDISDVPSLKHPSEYSTETEDNKKKEQNSENAEVSQSGTNMAKYLRGANPYLTNTSSDTLSLDSENVNSKSSTDTTRVAPDLLKSSLQPQLRSDLKQSAVPSSTSSSIYSIETSPNIDSSTGKTASNTKTNSHGPPTSISKQKYDQSSSHQIPVMSPKRLDDIRKITNRSCLRTLRGSSNEATLSHNIVYPASDSSSSPPYHSKKPSNSPSSGNLASHEASKCFPKAPQASTTSRRLPDHVPLYIDKDNSALYPKEPPARKSSFEKERPAKDNLGFRSMSLREPLITKNATATAAENLDVEEKKEKGGHVSRKSWTFGLPSPLKRRTSHSTHTTNDTEIVNPMTSFKNKTNENDMPILANKKSCNNDDSSPYTASSMNTNDVSEAGTEGHRFSLFGNKSQLSNRNISGGTATLESSNPDLPTALPLSVPVTIIDKNGEIHKLHNDDAAIKDKSHDRHGHSKFGRKLKKIFGRK